MTDTTTPRHKGPRFADPEWAKLQADAEAKIAAYEADSYGDTPFDEDDYEDVDYSKVNLDLMPGGYL